MRRTLLLSVALLLPAGAAVADFPTRAPRATLVDVLKGGTQALLFDRVTGDYAVVKVGDTLQGFKVAEIEADQIVLSVPDVEGRFFVLPLVDKTPTPIPSPTPSASPIPSPTPSTSPTPIPSTSTSTIPSTSASDMLDPYAPASTPTEVAEPVLDPYDIYSESKVTEVKAPDTTPPPPAAVPVDTAVVAPVVAPAPKDDRRTLSRKDLDRALANFATLAKEVQIVLAEGGGVQITHLSRGAFLQRIGLESGDVVRRVAGHTIDTVDDAASAYATVLRSKEVVVELERKGARMTVRYQMID